MFQPTSESVNECILQEGKRIYQELSDKYHNQKDVVPNSLCAALLCFMKVNVKEDNYPYFVQIVHKILSHNSQT